MSSSGRSSSHSKFKDAVEALWRLPEEAFSTATTTPTYASFIASATPLCGAVRDFGGSISLSSALAGLGIPCGLPGNARHLAMSAQEAGTQLLAAFEATSFRRTHLIPLDLSDTLPKVTFGNSHVGRMSIEELRHHVGYDRLARIHGGGSFDLAGFQQFHWLIVEEQVPVKRGQDGRELYRFHFDASEDHGRIEPHQSQYPKAVEQALFWLALAPWERWVESPQFGWRGFHVPWVYTVDHDLFATLRQPPSPDTLSWEEHLVYNGDGEPVEQTRPIACWLSEDIDAELTAHFNLRGSAIARFDELELLQTPMPHFLTRAYLSNGIDEFLGHLLAIEAGVGLPGDRGRKDSAGKKTVDTRGPSERIVARLAALLDVPSAESYRELFKARSVFLHGRSMPAIPAHQVILARSLARRVVDALVLANQADPSLERGAFVDALFSHGVQLIAAKEN